VLIGRQQTPDRDFAALRADLIVALKKVGAYREKDHHA
jgi:hypothetical protein